MRALVNLGDLNFRPYIELNVTPDDPHAGKQFQKSSVLGNVTNPAYIPWNKVEKFQFLIADKNKYKIHVALYVIVATSIDSTLPLHSFVVVFSFFDRFNLPRNGKFKPLGDAFIPVKDASLEPHEIFYTPFGTDRRQTFNFREATIEFVNPATGRKTGCKVSIN